MLFHQLIAAHVEVLDLQVAIDVPLADDLEDCERLVHRAELFRGDLALLLRVDLQDEQWVTFVLGAVVDANLHTIFSFSSPQRRRCLFLLVLRRRVLLGSPDLWRQLIVHVARETVAPFAPHLIAALLDVGAVLARLLRLLPGHPPACFHYVVKPREVAVNGASMPVDAS